MKHFLVPAALLSLCGAVANASTITIPTNGSSVYFQENPNPNSTLRSLGQTFVVPAPFTDTVLTDFAFTFAAGTGTSFDYRAYLFEWDTATTRATGTALFTSAVRNGSQAPSFTGLNLALTPGTVYIALLTTEGALNNGFGDGLLTHHSGNPYAGGAAFSQISPTSNGSTGNGSWTSVAWNPVNGNTDFQFSANFAAPAAVPEPASAALIALGGAAILGLRRILQNRA